MTPRRMIASIAIGVLLLIGAPAAWYVSQPANTVGDLDALVGAPVEAEPSRAIVTGSDVETDDAPVAVPNGEVAPEPVASVHRGPGTLNGPLGYVSRPERIAVPTIGVDAPVVEVGLRDDGSMEIPRDVATVGWFAPGVRPGQPGTAVLAGHVDSRSQGAGAFYDLRSLDVDDLVTMAGENGEDQQWRVVARTRYPRDELPIADIFTRQGDPRLVLITCGGDFDATARSYTDNIVVYAVPA